MRRYDCRPCRSLSTIEAVLGVQVESAGSDDNQQVAKLVTPGSQQVN